MEHAVTLISHNMKTPPRLYVGTRGDPLKFGGRSHDVYFPSYMRRGYCYHAYSSHYGTYDRVMSNSEFCGSTSFYVVRRHYTTLHYTTLHMSRVHV